MGTEAVTTGAQVAEAARFSIVAMVVIVIVLWLLDKNGPDGPRRWSRFWTWIMSRFPTPTTRPVISQKSTQSPLAQAQMNAANGIATPQMDRKRAIAVAVEVVALAEVLAQPQEEIATIMRAIVRAYLSVRKDDGSVKLSQADLIRGTLGVVAGSGSAKWRAAKAAWDAEVERQMAPASSSKFPPLTPEQAAFREEAGLPKR